MGRCVRQNMLRPYLKIWEWEWIFGRAVKAISSLGVRSPCYRLLGTGNADSLHRPSTTTISQVVCICVCSVLPFTAKGNTEHTQIYRLQRGPKDFIRIHLSSSISFLTESCCLPVEQISVLLSFESRQLELFYYVAK